MAGFAANYTWNGLTDYWTNASAWTPPGQPGAGDTANILSGQVTVLSALTVGNVNLTGATLVSGPNFTVTGVFNNNNGTITGTNVIPGGGAFNSIDGTINGVLTIQNGATFTLTGANAFAQSGAITNSGTIIWAKGTGWQLAAGSVINNLSSGRF